LRGVCLLLDRGRTTQRARTYARARRPCRFSWPGPIIRDQNRLVGLPAGQQSAVGAVYGRRHVLQTQVGHVVRQPRRPGVGHQQHTEPVRRRQAGVLGRPGAHMEGVRGIPETGRKGQQTARYCLGDAVRVSTVYPVIGYRP